MNRLLAWDRLLTDMQGFVIGADSLFQAPAKTPCAQEGHMVSLQADTAANRVPEQEKSKDVCHLETGDAHPSRAAPKTIHIGFSLPERRASEPPALGIMSRFQEE